MESKSVLTMGFGKACRVTINLIKNNFFQLLHGNKKHLLKNVVPVKYTLKKNFFAAVTFKGL